MAQLADPLKGIADQRRRRGETVILDEVHAVAGSEAWWRVALV
ncbi:hypothetical protein ACNKHV_10365 [Shigella flexneri]